MDFQNVLGLSVWQNLRQSLHPKQQDYIGCLLKLAWQRLLLQLVMVAKLMCVGAWLNGCRRA